MKHTTVVLAAGLVLATAGVHAQREISLNGSRIPVESKIVKGQPYSAEIVSESVQTLADGNRIIQKTTGRVYRDGEGRVRREEDRPSGNPSISIADFVGGQSYTLNVERRTAQITLAPLKATWFNSPTGDLSASLVVLNNKLVELKLAEQQLAERQKIDDAKLAKLAAAAVATVQGRGGRGAVTVESGRGQATGNREETTEERLQDRLIGGVLASGTRRTTVIAAGA